VRIWLDGRAERLDLADPLAVPYGAYRVAAFQTFLSGRISTFGDNLAPLQLPRDVAAQHVVEFALHLDWKGDLGPGKKIPARRPRRVTRIGVLERSRPAALSRNSRTVLILMWPPW
jgi:hypothetical protein